ncbi:MAG TPA: sigma-54 dependent transcriptional regulator [Acidobacteriota bacterium]|nr:sigma-54-dependent Fis family transcriptional regulator [Acidobacteriota bacterium]HNR39814.1 sigma-54 dependent transcriptional regulator [Acidobacteriota bacterium]HNU01501.1 sigma-54 dependent transcriptional regulator [Acidobacteriota bacterium]HPB27864.1 sigma-54 dependent transcriptional regulator [Acidobacteriota bacterium]
MADTTPLILIADDQADVREAIRLLLKGEGFRSEAAASPEAALRAVAEREFDTVLMDLNYTRDTTSGQEGLDLLARLQAADAALPVVVMTAWASVDLAVAAMQRGARDFVTKPWDNERLLAILRNQVALRRALRDGARLEAENRLLRGATPTLIIGEAPPMRAALELARRVGPADAHVLITGENGTGKGLVARLLHELSPRAARPLVTVNIGGLAEGVFEAELFGHVRGAFTDARADRVGRFELAHGGTLFLDEIANIPPALQAKLLRVLECGEFERVGSSRTQVADVRVLSATNADLPAEVAAGRFRQDLFFRLNTVEIRLPPLRERREDIPVLAAHFLGRHGRRYRKDFDGFTDDALQALLQYPWPGNVRELDHVVERAVLLGGGRRIAAADLACRPAPAGPAPDELSLETMERLLIQKALERCDGNAEAAAAALGLSRSAMYRRLQKHRLS